MIVTREVTWVSHYGTRVGMVVRLEPSPRYPDESGPRRHRVCISSHEPIENPDKLRELAAALLEIADQFDAANILEVHES
jgi:hypothetical protein